MTEGIIDHLRSLEGAEVAAVVRDKGDGGRAARKVSLRSSDGDGRRLGDRPQARRRRARARGRLLDRPRVRGAGRVPLRRGRRQLYPASA